MEVKQIKASYTHTFLLYKHYAKRIPNIIFAFGLFIDNRLIGVITYGSPPTTGLHSISGYPCMELNRLCINEGSPKNCASILVGRSLQLLPKPYVIISYADANVGHIGYVYQATNWKYTGTSSCESYYEKNGKVFHSKTLSDKFGTRANKVLLKLGFIEKKQIGKHRYLFFLGTKYESKKMEKELQWKILPYPKGDTSRYSPQIIKTDISEFLK